MKTDLTRWVKTTLAGGRYQVTTVLGQGGMGTVFRACDRNLGTDVVIKVPRPELLADAEFTARFAAEIRSLVKLAHPHIVRVIDVGQHSGLPFVVLQYLEGGSLEDRRPRDRKGRFAPMPLRDLAGWLPDVAEALDFIHAQGYVHRDVKPANLLFDGHGNLFLGDFGIAKAVASRTESRCASLTGSGMVVGTPQYMAPEVILGKTIGGAADQYALGVMVFELLAGRPPFEDPTGPALFVAHTTRPAPSLAERVPSLPRSVIDAVDRALSKDPERRHLDCAVFARAVLATKEAPARPVPAPARKTRALAAPAAADPVLPTAVRRGRALRCPSCGGPVDTAGTTTGKRMRCFACDTLFTVPATVERPADPRAETGRTPQVRIDTKRQSSGPPPSAAEPSPPEQDAEAPDRPRWPLRVGAGGVLLLAVVALTWVLWPASMPEPFQLSLASAEVAVQGGGSGAVVVKLDRKGRVGAANLSVEGLPAGVKVAPQAVASGASQATLTLAVAADAVPGGYAVEVVAALGEQSQKRQLRLTVEPRPELKLVQPAAISLRAGEREPVKITIQRNGRAGQIDLRLANRPSRVEVQPQSVFIPAGSDHTTFDLVAEVAAPKSDQTVLIFAELGGRVLASTRLDVKVTPSGTQPDSRPPESKPSITIEPLPPIVMEAGTERSLPIAVRRHNCDGRLNVEVGRAAGVLCEPVGLDARKDRAEIRLKVQEGAADGPRRLQIVVHADGVGAEALLDLTVKTPQSLKLEVVKQQGSSVQFGEMASVQLGESIWFDIEFRRRGAPTPIHVKLEGPRVGVSLLSATGPTDRRTFRADQSLVRLVLGADSRAVLGTHSFRLVAWTEGAEEVKAVRDVSLAVVRGPEPQKTELTNPPRTPANAPEIPELPLGDKLKLAVTLEPIKDVTLRDYCDNLQTRFRITISISQPRFEDRKIRMERQNGVSLRSVLDRLADQVGGKCRVEGGSVDIGRR